MNIEIGKGSLNTLENLHGNITGVYAESVKGILSDIKERNKAIEDWEELDKEAQKELDRPRRYLLSKEEVAIISNSQKFVKENEVKIDIVKGSSIKTLGHKVTKMIEARRKR